MRYSSSSCQTPPRRVKAMGLLTVSSKDFILGPLRSYGGSLRSSSCHFHCLASCPQLPPQCALDQPCNQNHVYVQEISSPRLPFSSVGEHPSWYSNKLTNRNRKGLAYFNKEILIHVYKLRELSFNI